MFGSCSCRPLYDEIREGVAYPADRKIQAVERAWGSPIWYEAD
jgi:hypothetical protein